jgi:hypothetical protein
MDRLRTLKRNIVLVALSASSAVTLAASILLDSFLLVFIGLGLMIWASSLVYISSTKMMKLRLVVPPLRDAMYAVDGLLTRTGGDCHTIFTPSVTPGGRPSQERVCANPRDRVPMLPLGTHLFNEYVKASHVDLAQVDVDYLSELLEPILTDQLELATEFEMTHRDDVVHVRLRDYLLHELCAEIHAVDATMCRRTPCSVCSSLAMALTQVTRKPVGVDGTALSGNVLEISLKTHGP